MRARLGVAVSAFALAAAVTGVLVVRNATAVASATSSRYHTEPAGGGTGAGGVAADGTYPGGATAAGATAGGTPTGGTNAGGTPMGGTNAGGTPTGGTNASGGTTRPSPAAGSNTTAVPGSASPPAPATYAETAGDDASTWTSYTTAGGDQGPTVAAYATIRVSCVARGFAVADGNTNWYRIASSPWNNAYYVPADAFYNDGATSGSLFSTPHVDPAVPAC